MKAPSDRFNPRLLQRSQGASVIMILGALFIALFCGIWAWDMASYYACQTQGQTAVDAAALGAAHDMRPDYSNYWNVINEAKIIAKSNSVMGRSLRDNELQVQWLTPNILKVSATYQKPNTAAPFLCAMAGQKNDPRCNFMPIYVEGYAKRKSDGTTVPIPPTTTVWAPTIAKGEVWGDPHIGAFGRPKHYNGYGYDYDVQGEPGKIVSILSTPTINVSSQFIRWDALMQGTTVQGTMYNTLNTVHGPLKVKYTVDGKATIDYAYEGWTNKPLKNFDVMYVQLNDNCNYKKLLGYIYAFDYTPYGSNYKGVIIYTGRLYIVHYSKWNVYIDSEYSITKYGLTKYSPSVGTDGVLGSSIRFIDDNGNLLPMPRPYDSNGGGVLPAHWTEYVVDAANPYGCPKRGCSFGKSPVLGTCNGVGADLTGYVGPRGT